MSNWEKGSTHAWRKVRRAVLDANVLNNRGQCTLQTKVCTGIATQVHHTLGRGVTGDDPAYLTAVCMPCNLHVGDPMTTPDPPVAPKQWF